MGEFDDLAAKYGIAPAKAEDPFADLKTKYGVTAPTEKPPTVDMGPEARRAAGGGSPSRPRDLTAEEAGTSAGPETGSMQSNAPFPGVSVTTEQAPAPADAPPTDYVTRKPTTGGGETIRVSPGNPNEMADPLVQMGTAAAMGQAAGAGTGALLGMARVPAAAANLAGASVESGTANKAMGGDFTTGAALPLIMPAARAALRAPAALRDVVAEGAPARVQARTLRNLNEEAPKKLARGVTKAAGEDGEVLQTVVNRNPELKRPLAVEAKGRPAVAMRAVDETLANRNASLDGDYAKMQEHYAGQPASVQASVPQLLDDIEKFRIANKGDHEITGALDRAKKFLVDDFGADGVISPAELRRVKRSMGRVAFPPTEAASDTAKSQVNRMLYQPVKRQLRTLAENTPGVDVAKFMDANEDVATLIPVRNVLADHVERIANGKKTFIEAARHHAHLIASTVGAAAAGAMHSPVLAAASLAAPVAAKIATRVGRGLDYRLAEAQLRRVQAAQAARAAIAAPVSPAIAPAAAGIAAAQPARRGGLADLYLSPTP